MAKDLLIYLSMLALSKYLIGSVVGNISPNSFFKSLVYFFNSFASSLSFGGNASAFISPCK